MKKKKLQIMLIFGTRPEAIKLAPVILELKKRKTIRNIVVTTAQHRQMLDQVLDVFNLNVDYDLNIMRDNQSLFDITSRGLMELKKLLIKERPDIVLVQGDTTTTFIASLGAFYQKIPVAHVEAGLRTSDKYSPFPEEINRKLTSHIADLHFAPTEDAKRNLLSEGISSKNIMVTGNTVIDALKLILVRLKRPSVRMELETFFQQNHGFSPRKTKFILVTGHRRENFGQGLNDICHSLKLISERYPDIHIVYSTHMNPHVQRPVKNILGNSVNIHVIDPLEYLPFIYLMSKSYLILTDSGGIQEEAPFLGIPVLVMRDLSERNEAIAAGAARLIGSNREKIIRETENMLTDYKAYEKMRCFRELYGDGKASEKIIDQLISVAEKVIS